MASIELSIDTQVIVKLLSEMAGKEGQIITYAVMGQAVGRDLQRHDRHILESARRIVFRDHRLVFDTVVNAGLKLMTDEEVARSGERTTAHIRRSAKKQLRVFGYGIRNFDGLSKDAKTERPSAHTPPTAELSHR